MRFGPTDGPSDSLKRLYEVRLSEGRQWIVSDSRSSYTEGSIAEVSPRPTVSRYFFSLLSTFVLYRYSLCLKSAHILIE